MTRIGGEEFFEVSRRNVAVLLIFWVSYILSYLVLAQLVTVSIREEGTMITKLVRKRRSNLSRLVLLGQIPTRPRSLPPARSDGDMGKCSLTLSSPRHNISSIATTPTPGHDHGEDFSREHSETECFNSDSEFSPFMKASSSLINPFELRGDLLSSFVPEYSVAVVGVAVGLQGVLLIPASLLAIQRNFYNGNWPWLTVEMLTQWWRWIWTASLGLLFGALPITVILIESREYRDTPFLKKASILMTRLLSLASQYGLHKLLLVMLALFGLYGVAIILGIIQPIKLAEWLMLLNTGCVASTALASLVCVPIGAATLLKFISNKMVRPDALKELRLQKAKLDVQILTLEGALSLKTTGENDDDRLGEGASYELTPVCSRSLRSKLAELYSRSSELDLRLKSTGNPVRKNFMIIILMLVAGGSTLLLIYLQLCAFIKFLALQVFWHIPGVQLLDRLLFYFASLFGLIEELPSSSISNSSSLHYEAVNIIPIMWMTWISVSWASVNFMLFFFLGLLKLLKRNQRGRVRVRGKGEVEVEGNEKEEEGKKRGRTRGRRVGGEDRMMIKESILGVEFKRSFFQCHLNDILGSLSLLLVSTVSSIPIVIISGVTDYMDTTLPNRIQSHITYTSQLTRLLPPPLHSLINALHCTTLIRFPLLLWLILTYRGLLALGLTFIGLKAIRDSIRSLKVLLISYRKTD